jgi:hypothetical protein
VNTTPGAIFKILLSIIFQLFFRQEGLYYKKITEKDLITQIIRYSCSRNVCKKFVRRFVNTTPGVVFSKQLLQYSIILMISFNVGGS